MHLTQNLRGVTLAFLLGLPLALGGCSATGDRASTFSEDGIEDPFEDYNRVMFEVNLAIDDVILTPAAKGYRTVLAPGARDVVRDFLRNLSSPVVLVNNILQGDWDGALNTAQRFFINTASTGGLVDIAELEGYPYRDEDFGQTMGVGGVEEGPYLILPLLGPSNFRDTTGMVVDLFFDPINYINSDNFVQFLPIGRGVVGAVDSRSRNIETIEELRADSVDFYARVRSLYTQNRRIAINNGEGDLESFPTPGLDGN